MRTVDPEQWYKKIRKASVRLTRPGTGQEPSDNFEVRVRRSFCDAAKEYRTNCTVHGVKRLTDVDLSQLERYCHAAILAAAIWMGITTLCYNWYRLSSTSPTQVNLRSSQHAIQKIPFPAVALCSTNVISEGPLMNYTKFLDSQDQNNTYSSNQIREHLLSFGSLLTMDLPALDVMFMPFLMHADPKFNVSQLMYQFSPPCDSVLARCSWRGRALPCERLFATRATPLGYCCVFNSRYYSEDIHRSPKYLDMVGQDYGLSVVIKENVDDFAFIRRASKGLEVLLFDGSEYPILEGGGVRMYPVERNATVFISVTASAQYPGEEGLRGCSERSVGGARSGRSYAWCLAECRRRTLAALCGCRLYTFPPDPGDNDPVCSLTHLSCLNKHREKFIYYYPSGEADPALNEELQNGQICLQCAPDCTRVVYSASLTASRYSYFFREKIFRNIFTAGPKLENSTVIRLFYSSEHQKLFVLEANARWYETFATISSQWLGIIGATIIAASEVIFYITIRWIHHYRRRSRIEHLKAEA